MIKENEKSMESISLLIACENAEERREIRDAMSQFGFSQIEEASNGGEALLKIGHIHPDVVLLDIWLSKLDCVQAMANISKIASQIEREANIETLVMAKGFEDCVAVISDDNVSVIVKCEEKLLANQLVQIQEIACEQADVGIENIKIIEKKVL